MPESSDGAIPGYTSSQHDNVNISVWLFGLLNKTQKSERTTQKLFKKQIVFYLNKLCHATPSRRPDGAPDPPRGSRLHPAEARERQEVDDIPFSMINLV